MALQLGATFVARSFSGDKEQLVPLLKAALCHKGFAFIDIISPCVTFNNHATSTRSYDYVQEHCEAGNIADYVPVRAPVTSEQEEGISKNLTMHDGSRLRVHKGIDGFDPTHRDEAIPPHQHLQKTKGRS